MNFQGIAQVDLVFSEFEKKWYIIEVNPRLSGMTTTYSVLLEKSVCEMICDCAKKNVVEENFGKFVINIKFPLLTEERLSEIYAFDFVQFVHQIENKAAKQIREKGYCEVIFTGTDKRDLLENLETLKQKFPLETETEFVSAAKTLLEKI